MEYLRAGDRIRIKNPLTRKRILNALIREGYEAEIQGEYVVVISDRLGVRRWTH